MKTAKVVVGISARHCHLSQKDLETLFGEGYELQELRKLSGGEAFAAKEVVEISTPKNTMKVRVLGPVRPQTQIELARTDCFNLGISPPVRNSGDLKGSGPIKITGPKGSIDLEEGVIIAGRHIHIGSDLLEEWGKKDGDFIDVLVGGERGIIFKNVLLRAGKPSGKAEIHLDTDEGNAAMLNQQDVVEAILD